jgi:D-sedoheptulose 7-phosphate isomerase
MSIFGEHKRVALVRPIASAPRLDFQNAIINALTCRRTGLDAALAELMAWAMPLAEIAVLLVETVQTEHKVLVAGNGGSAAEAQHFAAEFVGRFKRERKPYAVLSLTTDTSILTAVSNDYGYQDVFARQVNAFGHPGDMLICFSTSGESENLVRAATVGRERLMLVVAVTGDRPSRLERLADLTVRVPVDDTALVQELHMMVTHILCDIAEAELAADEGASSE